MAKLLIFVSATIVLFLSTAVTWASPQYEIPKNSEESDDSQWPTDPPDENLSISKAPKVTGPLEAPRPRYYPYRQALTFRTGLSSDFPKLSMDDTIYGFQYLFPKFLSPKLEAGADLHENGRGHVHAGARWYAWERDYFRPSYKVSLDHWVDSEERLATFTKLANYYVRTSATVEYVVWNPYSLRLEIEFMFNLDKTRLVNTLGISRGW